MNGAPVRKPAFVKLGGSLISDKSGENVLRRPALRRLTSEIAKAEMPVVLFHGAGSYGHPQAMRAKIGSKPVATPAVTATLASVAMLQAEVVDAAQAAGLYPVAVSLQRTVAEGDNLTDLPVESITRLLEEGCTPVLSGTVVRDRTLGWRISSADALMAECSHDISPRIGVFATDVDGVYNGEPGKGELLPVVRPTTIPAMVESRRPDATGSMRGKLLRAFALAEACPVLILNGNVRGRLLDALKGKQVPSTRIETA